MDPFSAEGGKILELWLLLLQAEQTNSTAELLTVHNAFHQGQYQAVLDFDTSSLSESNVIPARVLKLRAQIANGDAKGAISSIKKESAPDFAAVKAFAQYSLRDTSTATKQIEQLVESSSENATVQILGGIVLQADGRTAEALSLLSKHQGNLEACVFFDSDIPCSSTDFTPLNSIALITQIHLQQNRTDLALKEVSAARKWAQDSLLVNIAESWVGMRVVRRPSYIPPTPLVVSTHDHLLTSVVPLPGR